MIKLQASTSGETITFDLVDFNDQECEFILSSSNNEEDKLFISYNQIVDRRYESNEYHFLVLKNEYYSAENDVFQIYQERERIGWVFPIQILVSDSNDFYENEHLNPYKFIAIKYLLSNSKIENTESPSITSQASYNLLDFFSSDIVIFIVSKNKCSLNLDTFLPSLYDYGYYIWSKNSTHSVSKRDAIKERPNKKIVLKETISPIFENDFFRILYYEHLNSQKNPLIRFFLLYQVIEFTLDLEFKYAFDNFLSEYQENNLSKNDFVNKLNEAKTEKKRIVKIFESIESEIGDSIKASFLDLLKQFNKSEENNIGILVYSTRNKIFHSFRDVINNKDMFNSFEQITHYFELAINALLRSYKSNSAEKAAARPPQEVGIA